MESYDLIIIGGGPGGYLAAERGAAGGLSTALFEKQSLGGVCLNEGCIPTKTLLNSAKIYEHTVNGGVYGVLAGDVKYDHPAVISRKDKVVKTLVSGVGAKMKAHKVNVVNGFAEIAGRSADGILVKSGEKTYACKNLIIATGSEPVIPPIDGVAEGIKTGFVLTNREILDMKTLPKRLTVIGGGVIGLEMASYFSTVGTKVTVIEMLDKIAGYTDAEVSSLLLKDMTKRGIDFKLGCKVTGITGGSVKYQAGDVAGEVEADAVLLSIGRRAVTKNIGLESLGIYTERGAIVTDENLRTNVTNVYAVGDVNGKSMLAHTAYREAEVACNHILGKRDCMRYDAIPSVIYTLPEVAGVGESEESAKEKGMDFAVRKVSMRYSGRFVAENDKSDGICKLLVENGTDRLIGVHLMGGYSSEIIYGAAMMIESHWKVDELKEIVFPHPTVSEIIREAFFEA